jgi:hypothetical protein
MSPNATGASALVEEAGVYVLATCLQEPLHAVVHVLFRVALQDDVIL